MVNFLKTKTVILLYAFFALFFASCASSPPSLRADENISKQKGVLLASVTRDPEREYWYKMKTNISGWFFLKKAGEEKEYRLDSHEMQLIGQHDDFEGDSTQTGQLVAISLDPGTYELTNWMLYVPSGSGYSYISPKEEPTPFVFDIVPSQVTYLGNLHLHMLYGENFLGFEVVSGLIPNISDKNKRDFEFLKSKYPQLVDWDIKKNIAVLNKRPNE